MTLFFGLVVSGIAIGLVYGLVGFSVVFTHKTTGIANFAVGNIATFAVYIVFLLYGAHLGLWGAIIVGVPATMIFALVLYVVVMRPADDASRENMLARTLGMYVLLYAITNLAMGSGQPFNFPTVLPGGGFSIRGVEISYATLTVIGITAVLVACFTLMFNFTSLGLEFQALSQNAAVARMLGVRVRRLSAVAWMAVAVILLIAGLIVAPTFLLSSDMMDAALLYAFTAASIGGITSLGGAFVGGIAIGVVTNVITGYLGGADALAIAFLMLMAFMWALPNGFFGRAHIERL